MTDREKLIELLGFVTYMYFDAHENREAIADYLIKNGVTFATDTNVGSKWISVEDEKPVDFVSVLGHMTNAGEMPAVRECYHVENGFYFPALREIHPVDRWAYMPE